MRKQHNNFGMKLKYISYAPILLGVIFLTGCIPSPTAPAPAVTHLDNTPSTQPKWVYETSKDGKIGGVGISKPHFNGKTAQRMLAISRALDEIAKQMGVKVSTIQKISSVANSDNSTTNLESYSFQTTNGKVISAKIQSFWEDKTTDELYVWMVVE
jgi:PBP1b-binding outer membrane lipoprotein LpoB